MRTQMPSVLPLPLLLALLSAVTLQSVAANRGPYPPPTGVWNRIKKVDDYPVPEIARLAVSQHNNRTGNSLEYIRVYRGYVDGPFYRLFIQATDHAKARRYEAVVRDDLWPKMRQLVYFRASS
ncbi:unnamed protein product [Spirodela intermedia]|uniref:Cystatin domain-containing protein n=2 Tax=Spirodela intermedia TaxID=51605 RepID=A0A7I8IN02_SPIIN|nr:unnamed protein product [Spirodela intermedia]CAA6659169.1 unnamed protein product [Spirodela intermedia]CAA7395480.1 unnamed protein product [Spirodela intermedia]CAA7395485.1 unnamed protein product [Spirodela intermedia]